MNDATLALADIVGDYAKRLDELTERAFRLERQMRTDNLGNAEAIVANAAVTIDTYETLRPLVKKLITHCSGLLDAQLVPPHEKLVLSLRQQELESKYLSAPVAFDLLEKAVGSKKVRGIIDSFRVTPVR